MACGVLRGKLFEMLIRVNVPDFSCTSEANVAAKDSLQIWHERLAHQNKRHIFLEEKWDRDI